MLTIFAAALLTIIIMSAGSVHAMARAVVTLSALPISQPAQRAWLKQSVYAALPTNHAALGFVVQGDIATPSMVRARTASGGDAGAGHAGGTGQRYQRSLQ